MPIILLNTNFHTKDLKIKIPLGNNNNEAKIVIGNVSSTDARNRIGN